MPWLENCVNMRLGGPVLRLKRLLRLFRSYFPSQLPQSGQGMDLFIADILDLAQLPDNSSFKTAIATQIMHVGPDSSRVAKRSFIIALQKAIANQLAYEIIQREKKASSEATPEVQ